MYGDHEEDSREADVSSECSASLSPEEEIVRHKVSKHDNLAGLAIKYGVTVFDIKAVNGLHSDAAMFARDTLIIPLRKGDSRTQVNRDAMVRFVGGLGGRSFDPPLSLDRNPASPLPQTGSANTEAGGVDGIFTFSDRMRPLQEIELREHVGYAGSRSGIEDRPLIEQIRRRKRDDDADISNEIMGDYSDESIKPNMFQSRPPVPPNRNRDWLPSGSGTKQSESSQIFDYFKGWQSSFVGKVKEVMNSSAFGDGSLEPPRAAAGRVRPASSMSVTPRRQSDLGMPRVGSASSLNDAATKICPKAD